MLRHCLRALTAVVLAAVLSVAGLVVASPASAHPVYWGWSDNHTLCTDTSWCVRRGNLTRMWQTILWVDGYDNSQGTAFIDGDFGTNTHNQTYLYQLFLIGDNQADGEVGPITWGFANEGLCDDWISGNYVYYTYCGSTGGPSRTAQMREHRTSGEWSFVNPRTGAWTNTNHN